MVRCHSLVSRDIPLSICVHGKLVTIVWFIVPSCNIICMFYLRWHRQSCTYSTQFASLLVVCCQVKFAKSCSNVGQVDQKLVKRWSKVGQKLVKLVENWLNWSSISQVGQAGQKLVKLVKLVKNWSRIGQELGKNWSSWSSWSKVGQAGQKVTNLVKLVKNMSSWWKVVQKLSGLVKLFKNWSSWSKIGRKFHQTNSTNSRTQKVLAAKFRPLTSVFLGNFWKFAKLFLSGLNLAASTSCALELVEFVKFCQGLVKLVKRWSSWSKNDQLGQVGQKLVKLVSWSKIGQELVKSVKS